MALAVRSDAQWPARRDQLIDTLKRGYDRARAQESLGVAALIAPNEREVDSWYAPRDRTIALIQSAMG